MYCSWYEICVYVHVCQQTFHHTALRECGIATVVTPGESGCRGWCRGENSCCLDIILFGSSAVGKLITTLKGKHISTDQALALAKSFQLSAEELGDPPETELSTLSDRWMKKDSGATPEGLVEALMCCEGLGKYVSGMGCKYNVHLCFTTMTTHSIYTL